MAIAGTTFNKAIALLDYQVNKNYIAATLCENRNKPACCCHGKCFLKKQLQKDEDSGKKSPSASKDKFDVSFFWEPGSANDLNHEVSNTIYGDSYLSSKYSAALSPVFRPPGKM
jgi:hypothetical protein